MIVILSFYVALMFNAYYYFVKTTPSIKYNVECGGSRQIIENSVKDSYPFDTIFRREVDIIHFLKGVKMINNIRVLDLLLNSPLPMTVR